MNAESPRLNASPSNTHPQTTRTKRAARLLKVTPFDFVQPGGDNQNVGLAFPRDFQAPVDKKNWNDALAVFHVLHTKPATWQWNSDRVRRFGSLSDRSVRRGIKKLKEEGWVQHVNVYDENRKILSTFLMVAKIQLPQEHRKGRFSLLMTSSGWILRTPGGESKKAPETRTRRKRMTDSFPAVGVSENTTAQASEPCDLFVHHPYGHNRGNVKTLTLKRAEPDFSVPSAAQSGTTQHVSPPHAPEEPSENLINNRKYLARKLEQLGEKRDDSVEAALAYEEFVVTQIISELSLPEKTHRPRRKIWNLAWMESSLLGMILLKMSSSPGWDVKCARRVIRRADEGYIQFDDIRILLFAFDWTRSRNSRKTLEAMTYYGKNFDDNKGEVVTVDSWKRMISNARDTYRRGILGPVLEQRNRLFPQNEDDLGVNWGVRDRVVNQMRDICTGAVAPKEEFYYKPTEPDCLALLLSRCRRSEKLQTMVDEAKDLLEEYFATDYAGILLYRSNYHLIPETMGLTLEGIKKRHHERVDMIHQRLSYHGIATDDVQPYI